jgi:hypothetical protein
VEEIKETVSEQVAVAKQTVAGVLDYREQFQNEPLVWSLGALSAGFALGYTMGYAHKETSGSRKKSEVAAFTNSLVDELQLVGNRLVMPALNSRIKELFGFDFSAVLTAIGNERKASPKRKPAKKTKATTTRSKKKRAAKAH